MVDDAPIPLEAVPAIRAAVRDPLLLIAGPIDVAVLAARTADAWHVWHQSTQHRADLGRLLPRLITDARIAARAAGGHDRRAAHAVLADVYALVQHEVVGEMTVDEVDHGRARISHRARSLAASIGLPP
jgi:alkanesulfonate monooxygenase SsuD/methylene tetrahydromethanopterin reductase-like flavin-dependent oxidoreductase (luciferase family)